MTLSTGGIRELVYSQSKPELNFMRRIYALFVCLISLSTNVFAQPPVAAFATATPQGCAPLNGNFFDNSTNNPNSWDWDFGDLNAPAHGFVQNPTHIYLFPGTYTVTLIVINASGSDTLVKTGLIRVFPNPVASYIMTDDSVCSGSSITFTDSSVPGDTTINNYQWSFNDGSAAVFTNPVSHVFTNTTMNALYYVPTYTVTDIFGCSSTISGDTVNAFPVPVPDLGADTLYACQGQTYSVTPGIFAAYLWFDGSISPTYMVPTQQPDTMTIKVMVWNQFNCPSDVDSSVVVILVCSSTEEIDNFTSVYPNPFSNIIKINSRQPLNGANYLLFDLTGKIIMQGTINNNLIDADELATGMYFLRIADRTFIVTKSVD
jgi:PKD repeat protein